VTRDNSVDDFDSMEIRLGTKFDCAGVYSDRFRSERRYSWTITARRSKLCKFWDASLKRAANITMAAQLSGDLIG